MNTMPAVVREGQIELVDKIELPEGAQLLVTLLSSDETPFWQGVSQDSLASVWDNNEDDIYAELLEK